MTPTNITLEPVGLLKSDGSYVLQTKDIHNLLKFVWTGVLLPNDQASYVKWIGVKEIKKGISGLVDTLLKDYKLISKHSKTFKDGTYPQIVHIADLVYSYADTAGGTSDNSYYANILKSSSDLFTELAKDQAHQNPATIKELKETVIELVDTQTKAIVVLKTKAEFVVKSLKEFEKDCRTDQKNLQSTKKQLRDELEGEGGEMKKLEAELKTKREELRREETEYEHDKIVAETAPSYCWCTVIGLIAAIIVAGIYGAAAAKVKKTIDDIQKTIDNDNATLQADKAIVADMHLIDSDLNSVIELIVPAITTIEKMVGIWDAVGQDLESVRKLVETGKSHETVLVQSISERKILGKWNTLRDSVDKYRKVAYISNPEIKSLKQISDILGENAKSSKPV